MSKTFEKLVQFSLSPISSLADVTEDTWVNRYNFSTFMRSNLGVDFEYYPIHNSFETYCLSTNKKIAIVDGYGMGIFLAAQDICNTFLKKIPDSQKEITLEYSYLRLFQFFAYINKNFHFALRVNLLLNSPRYHNKGLIDLMELAIESNATTTKMNHFVNTSFPVFHELGHWISEKTNTYRFLLDLFSEEKCKDFIHKTLDFPENKFNDFHKKTALDNLENKDFILNLKNVKRELDADVAGTMLMFDFLSGVPEFNINRTVEGLKNTKEATLQLLHFTYKLYLVYGLYSDSKVFAIQKKEGNSLDYFRKLVYSPILLEARKFAVTTAITHRFAHDNNMDSDLVYERYVGQTFDAHVSLDISYRAIAYIRKLLFYNPASNYDMFEAYIIGGRKYSVPNTCKLLLEYFDKMVMPGNIWPGITIKDINVEEIW